jgi:hypothetical protein
MAAKLFTVKLYYFSGEFERIQHAPASLALPVYAEAEDNGRCAAAEIIGETSHRVIKSFRHEPVDSPRDVG